jgi:hypothetical protein
VLRRLGAGTRETYVLMLAGLGIVGFVAARRHR